VVFALVADDPATAAVVLALALSGAGIGAAQPRLTACVANAVPVADLGIAGATQLLVAQVGTTLGMNVMEAVEVVSSSSSATTGSSFSTAYVVGAAVSACGVGLSLRLRE
jgi:hypothetical protein